jgi:acyl-CoA synthetase (AMP-forming)/AMP-acid ligase II
MEQSESLASIITRFPSEERRLSDKQSEVSFAEFKGGTCFNLDVTTLRGCTVLLSTSSQLSTVLAMIELDGLARRVLLCTPNLEPFYGPIMAEADVDTIVSDVGSNIDIFRKPIVRCYDRIIFQNPVRSSIRDIATEWVLFTSGTTGAPKMVSHTLRSLAGPLDDGVPVAPETVWSTFYDIRRYGGLQILLRALLGGGSMVLSDADESVGDFLLRLSAANVQRISGTPSHWRKALMSPHASAISPTYVRLSGEVADQAILDRLHRTYPSANVAHAFASTEAGVAFDVRDGQAGFPASFLDATNHAGVELRIKDDTLWIRSSRTASGYIGHQFAADDGFINTGDIIERRGDRCFFMGRREGVINVGGQKVFPEEVENVITRHPDVQAAHVRSRKNPITGAVVVADILLRHPVTDTEFEDICVSLRTNCELDLARYKMPVIWKQVTSLKMTTTGKIQRA